MTNTTPAEPRQTSRDVSWSVMFRLARTSVWVEWSNGHRDPAEAIDSAAPLRTRDGIATIRIDRITRTRDMFSIDDLTPAAGGEAR